MCGVNWLNNAAVTFMVLIFQVDGDRNDGAGDHSVGAGVKVSDGSISTGVKGIVVNGSNDDDDDDDCHYAISMCRSW